MTQCPRVVSVSAQAATWRASSSQALGYPVKQEWRPWLSDQLGGKRGPSAMAVGYVTQFGGDSRDFRFATVRRHAPLESLPNRIAVRHSPAAPVSLGPKPLQRRGGEDDERRLDQVDHSGGGTVQ